MEGKNKKALTKEEILKKRMALKEESNALWNDITNHSKEEVRIINVLDNAETILDELDKTFEERTSLSKTDISILMVATVLQLLRIYLLPKFQEKFLDEDRLDHDDKIIKDMETEEQNSYTDKHSKWDYNKSEKGYRTWLEIAKTKKVPYDATRHSRQGNNNRNMHGREHRVKSLGHDPILGWIFGVANIMTDTITICPEYNLGEKNIRIPMIETYTVDMGSNFCWKEKTDTWQMFKNSKESYDEDKHRLYAAIFAQGLHIASDRYTHLGLPIPKSGRIQELNHRLTIYWYS